MMTMLKGTTHVEREYTREEAAALLKPPVSTVTLRNYVELASTYLESFKEFENKATGGVNRFARLRSYHIESLQLIREYIHNRGTSELKIALTRQPEYFEGYLNER